MTELRDLLEALRQGERPPLSVDDVELLLGWLTGSAARDGEPGDELPRPGHDPVLLQMVLHRLDDVLFDGGELKPAAAGLDPEAPATRRRIRFRRLASAFHPDRFPELADWLTQRSQAVHRAYARFKQDPEAPAVVPPPAPGPVGRNVRRAAPRARKHRFRAFANQLRARFGNDRYLAHKLIGGLAVLALLPVLNMVLVPSPSTGESAGSAVSSSDSVDAERPVSDANSPTTKLSTGEGAGPAGDGAQPDSESLARQAPTRVDGSDPAEDANPAPALSTDVGAGPAGDGRSPDSDSLARQAPTPVASPEAATESVGAASSRGDRGPKTRSLARQAPTRVDGSDPAEDANPAPALSTDVGAGPAGEEPSPEARMAAASGDAAEPDAPARKPETGNPKPAPSAQPDSDLVLGPLGRHPAGEVLQRFHAALQAGNIAGVAGSFAPDARMDSLRGRNEIAEHFRTGLDSVESRRVKLKVRRLGRDDDGWRVEADLDVRVDRNGNRENLLAGRSNFLLTGRGDQLLISRLEVE